MSPIFISRIAGVRTPLRDDLLETLVRLLYRARIVLVDRIYAIMAFFNECHNDVRLVTGSRNTLRTRGQNQTRVQQSC